MQQNCRGSGRLWWPREKEKEEQRQAKEQKDKEILDSLDAKIKEFEEAAKI